MIGTLNIRVKSVSDVPAVDSNGFSDPYVRLQFEDQSVETKVVKACLDPVFNEDFAFDVKSAFSVIHIELWDSDVVYRDTLIAIANQDIVKLTSKQQDVEVVLHRVGNRKKGKDTVDVEAEEHINAGADRSKSREEEDVDEFIVCSLQCQFVSSVAGTNKNIGPVESQMRTSLESALAVSDEGADHVGSDGDGEAGFSLLKSNIAVKRLSVASSSVFYMIHSMQDVLAWKRDYVTYLAYVAFVFTCMFPNIVFRCGPFILLLLYLRARRDAMISSSFLTHSEASISLRKRMGNMKDIQNMTKQFCDLNDALYSWDNALFSWSAPAIAERTRFYLFVGLAVSFLSIFLIRLDVFVWLCGTCVFALGNRKLVRFVGAGGLKLLESIQEKEKGKREGKDGEECVDIWENQRWWLGRGWVEATGSKSIAGLRLSVPDHPAWSNEDGSVELCMEDMEGELPYGWVWSTEWEVGEWMYGVKSFSSEFTVDSKGSYVRRRRWIRKMKMKV